MIIKEKRWLSRIVAMLCVLTMVVGVLTPASVGVALTTSVTTIKLKREPGITYIDEKGDSMEDLAPSFDDEDYEICTNYKYKISNDEQFIQIEPIEGRFSVNPVVYADQSNGKPVLQSNNNVKPSVGALSINGYKITINLRNENDNNETEISLKKQYTITFPTLDTDDYLISEITGANKDTTDSTKYISDGTKDVTFTVTNRNDQKDLKVKVNNKTLDPSLENKNKYSIKEINENKTITIELSDKKYNVELNTAQVGFTFTSTSSSNVSYDGSYGFYIVPVSGNEVEAVYAVKADKAFDVNNPGDIKPLPQVSTNYYVISNITESKTIYVKIEKQNYTVSFTRGTRYSINNYAGDSPSPMPETKVVGYNEEIVFDIETASGYKVSRVTASNNNGTDILQKTGADHYKYNITANTIISVDVEKEEYEISYNPNNGSEEYDLVKGSETAEYGDTYNFYVTPKDEYKTPVVTAKIKDTETNVPIVVNGNLYTINRITGNTEITIQSSGKNTYEISYNSGEGYSFHKTTHEDVPDKIVSYDDSVEFVLHVDKDYSDSNPIVLVNGRTVSGTLQDTCGKKGKDYKYVINNVRENQFISINGIQKNMYTVKLIDGSGYKLETTQSTSVAAGTEFTFRWTVSEGYKKPDKININGSSHSDEATHNTGYDFTGTCSFKVEGNTSVSLEGVTALTSKVIIDNDQSDNAEVKQVGNPGFDKDNIPYGDSYSFEVIPSNYYKIVTVKVNDIPITSISGVYTIENIKADKKITVETEPVELTVHYVDNKYNTEIQDDVFDITKTDKVGTDGKITKDKLENIDDTKKLYKFEGWDKEEVSLATNNKDSEITLTAKWTLKNRIASNEYVNLTTTGESSSKGFNDGKTSYTYKLSFHSLFKLAEDLEEDLNNIAITGYGTFYSDNDITVDEDCFNSITDRKKEQSPTLYKAAVGDTSEHINNYYANVTGLYASDLNDTNNFFYLNIGANTSGITRHAVGWIELSIGKETIVIYSEDIPVTTAAERQ